jgi:FtsP/CotA-like multicopper oxidase with cupredoxin domain
MRRIRVKQGDVVTLRWTADRPTVLHLHGYDIEWRVQPGTVGKITFTARLTGRFPVHVHDTVKRANDHAHEDSPLVYVEVYPR